MPDTLPPLLLPYQAKWLQDSASFRIWEKSRRIGASWAVACEAVLLAAAQRGMDCYYISYNQDMTRQFIDDCAMWAKAFDIGASAIGEVVLEDSGQKPVLVYEIHFASGYVVQAMSSRPTNFRSKQGYAIIDEAAYVDDLRGLLKAAAAFYIWGGRVAVLSTHNGVDNEFNLLLEDVRKGKLNYSIHRTTFDDAIADGLYRRICLVRGFEYKKENERPWRDDVVAQYEGADEELHCIPAKSGGVYISRVLAESVMHSNGVVARLECKPEFAFEKDEKERTAIIAEWLDTTIKPWLRKLPADRLHFVGQDFGRVSDLSSIAIGTLRSDNTRYCAIVIEMSKVPYESQKQVLFYIMSNVPRFAYLCIDSTGNGAYLGEVAAQRSKNRVEQVKFTEKVWAEELPKLKAALEAKKLWLPTDADIKEDFKSFLVMNGTPRLPASSGGKRHGDSAVAIMLMNRASNSEYPVVEYESVSTSVWLNAKKGMW